MRELPSHSALLKIVGILHEVRLAAAVARQPGGICHTDNIPPGLKMAAFLDVFNPQGP